VNLIYLRDFPHVFIDLAVLHPIVNNPEREDPHGNPEERNDVGMV
jgi:hypothetical protein